MTYNIDTSNRISYNSGRSTPVRLTEIFPARRPLCSKTRIHNSNILFDSLMEEVMRVSSVIMFLLFIVLAGFFIESMEREATLRGENSQSALDAATEAAATNAVPAPFEPEPFIAYEGKNGVIIFSEKVIWQLESYHFPSGQTPNNPRLTLVRIIVDEDGSAMYCLITSGGDWRDAYFFDRECWPAQPAE